MIYWTTLKLRTSAHQETPPRKKKQATELQMIILTHINNSGIYAKYIKYVETHSDQVRIRILTLLTWHLRKSSHINSSEKSYSVKRHNRHTSYLQGIFPKNQ